MSYTLTEEQRRQLLAALEINRVMGADENGNYTREITPKLITEAIAVLQSLTSATPAYKYTVTDSNWSEP